MMKRYSIMVRQRGANREVELCQCETHPEAIVKAAQDKFVLIASGSRKVRA